MSKGNPIPPQSRRIVESRDLWRCARCLMKATDWHHRRSRRVVDVHQHCPCNGVMLCRTCHKWAHANPEKAMTTGLIVSQWTPMPWSVPIRRPDGWWLMRCAGMGVALRAGEVGGGAVPKITLDAADRLNMDLSAEVW